MVHFQGKLVPLVVKKFIISKSWAPSLYINDFGKDSILMVSTLLFKNLVRYEIVYSNRPGFIMFEPMYATSDFIDLLVPLDLIDTADVFLPLTSSSASTTFNEFPTTILNFPSFLKKNP